MQKFQFDRKFQIGILALMMQRHDFLLMASDIIKAEYFEDKVLIWFFQKLRDFYIKYGHAPDRAALENEILIACKKKTIRPSELQEYVDVRMKLTQRVNSQDYVIEQVIRFCRRQAGRKIYLETAPIMDTADEDDWDDILERLAAVRNIGMNYLDVGVRYFEDVGQRTHRRFTGDDRTISPTGIAGWDTNGRRVNLDDYLQGGCKGGQLAMWMGGTGVGKSIALPQMGKRAVVDGLNVVHYTLELSEEDIADRYDASWSHVNFSSLTTPGSIMEVDGHIRKLASRPRYANRLIIKEYPTGTATVATIRSHLKQLEQMNWYPDVIIVDYLDLLKPLTNYKDEYADLGAIARDLRGMAMELKVPVWSATQTNRSGLNQEVVDIEHIGDSLKKAQIADIVLALSATREDRDNNVLKIFLAKNRNGPAKRQIEIRSDYSRMLLYDANGSCPTLPKSTTPPPTIT